MFKRKLSYRYRIAIPRLLSLFFGCWFIVSCGGGGGKPDTVEPPLVEKTNWDEITWDADNWQ